jgi:lambda repressor-like predicted transcriptional regulator
MAQKLTKRKRKALGIRIKPKEGLWIKYQLRLRGISLTDFAKQRGVSIATISNVLRGLRKSAPLELAVVQTLGYPSFERMISAARGKGGAA